MFFTRIVLLARARSDIHAAATTVVADVIYRHIIDDGFVVNPRDMAIAEVVDRLVVIERATIPVTALITVTVISITVIHAAVKPDLRAPVTAVEAITSITPRPVTRRPEQTN